MKHITPQSTHPHMSTTLVVMLGVLLFMPQPVGTDLYLPAMPSLAAEFGIGVGQVAHTMTAFLIGFALMQLLAGPISDRWGRRPVALGGVALYTTASLGCALAPSFDALLVARFFQAAGACTCFAVARAIVRDSFAAQDGAWVLSKVNSYMVAAPITGVLIGGAMASTLGWRYNFGLIVVFGAGVMIVMFLKLQETLKHGDVQRINLHNLWQGYRTVLANRTFTTYTAVSFVGCAGLFCHLSASSMVYARVLGASPWLYSVCFAVGCLGYLTGTVLLRRWLAALGLVGVIHRASWVQIIAIGISLSCAYGGLVHWAVVAGCNYFFLVGYGLMMSACQAGSVAPFPDRAGMASSLMGALQISGGALAGWWMGAAYNGTVFPMLLTQWICGVAVLGLVLTWVRRYGKV